MDGNYGRLWGCRCGLCGGFGCERAVAPQAAVGLWCRAVGREVLTAERLYLFDVSGRRPAVLEVHSAVGGGVGVVGFKDGELYSVPPPVRNAATGTVRRTLRFVYKVSFQLYILRGYEKEKGPISACRCGFRTPYSSSSFQREKHRSSPERSIN